MRMNRNNSNPIPYRGRITDLPPDDKPREKAMRLGISALTDVELLAILLGSGIQGKSAIDLAKEILASCGNNAGRLARLSIAEMSRKFDGVGPARAVTIAAAIELGGRVNALKADDTPRFTSSDRIFAYMQPRLAHLEHEEFHALMLKRSGHLKDDVTISRGGIAATVVDKKLLLKEAIDRLAASIILVHNHPSGNLRPSHEDDKLTKEIAEIAKMLDIPILDHIIVTARGYYSYHDEGRL